MSKSKFIVFVVLYMLIFMNCQGKETMRLFTSHDQKNLEIADKIITYLDLKDEDGLYSLFSEQVIEEDEALKDEILALFSSYHGSVVKYEEWAIGVETKIEKGDKLSQYYSRFLVWIGETEYMLHYIYIVENSFNRETEGVRTIKFIRKEDEEKYFCYWDQLKAGVFIPE